MASFLPTSGAVAVRNAKGDLVLQKVKVKRYVQGKRPEYAPGESQLEDDSDDETFIADRGAAKVEEVRAPLALPDGGTDRRLQRLMGAERKVHEAEVVVSRSRRRHVSSDEDEDDISDRVSRMDVDRKRQDSEDSDDEDARDRRRQMVRERAEVLRKEEERQMAEQAAAKAASSESESEYEEYTDEEEEEEEGPILKPVFVRASDRVTIKEREAEEEAAIALEEARLKTLEERKEESHTMLIDVLKGKSASKVVGESDSDADAGEELSDGDGDEQEEFEKWKVRELVRIKRDRDEREARRAELAEIERRRNMTDEEIRAEQKLITNEAPKGKYRFMQKYYHRGAFYLDEDEEVFKRDYTEATGMDTVDKTILPKVMQVKDFGRAGRTKYTHLADQDTTQADSPWLQQNPINARVQQKMGGMKKGGLDRPSSKRNT